MEKEIIAPSGEKVEWKPGTMIYPLPAALISCRRHRERIQCTHCQLGRDDMQ